MTSDWSLLSELDDCGLFGCGHRVDGRGDPRVPVNASEITVNSVSCEARSPSTAMFFFVSHAKGTDAALAQVHIR